MFLATAVEQPLGFWLVARTVNGPVGQVGPIDLTSSTSEPRMRESLLMTLSKAGITDATIESSPYPLETTH